MVDFSLGKQVFVVHDRVDEGHRYRYAWQFIKIAGKINFANSDF
jgi:hypothetical protein